MLLLISESAAELITERGGCLYVWPTRAGCCGGVTRLRSASTPPEEKDFRRVDAVGDCEVYVPSGLGRLPDELHIELKRYPRRIESYWDGCAWVVY